MKRIFILQAVLFFLLFEANASDSWVLKNFPDSVSINGICINSANEIFVIAHYISDEVDAWPVGVVYHSGDDGNNWIQISPLHHFPEIMDILIDINDNIYLGTWNGGIYKSEDNGVTWVQKNEGLSNEVPFILAQNTSDHIFAGQFWGGGIDFSTNGGESWTQLTNSDSGVSCLGISSNDYIFVDGDKYTPDNGITWISIIDGLPDISCGCYAFNKKNEVFMGRNDGVYSFHPIDSVWTKVLSIEGVSQIIISSDNKLFLGSKSGVFSSENGQDWDNISDEFISSKPRTFSFDNEGYLWAAAENIIYKSQNVLTGIHANTAKPNNARVFPNPFRDNLIVDFANTLQEGETISIQVFNFDGKLQKSITDKVFNNQVVISLKNLESGPYLIKIDQKGFNIKNSIIIKE